MIFPKMEPGTAGLGVAYGRTSTGLQDLSIEAQNEGLIRYAAANNLVLPPENILLEDDTSGSIPFIHRPKASQVLRILSGKDGSRTATHLIVSKIDRLGRGAMDVQNTIQKIHAFSPQHRIHIIDLGGASLDTRSPMAGMIIALLAWFAEMEVVRIRERIYTALDHKKRHNEVTGTIPYGWDAAPTGRFKTRRDATQVEIRVMVDNVAEQAIIRQIAALRSNRWSYEAIAKHLNSLNIPAKTKKGAMINTATGPRICSGKWSAGSVHHVLNNQYSQRLLTQAQAAA